MSKLMKVILALFLVLAIVAASIYWDSYLNSPTNYKVTYLDVKNEKIPENFKGIKVLYFSDLCYGTIFDEQHLKQLETTISTLDFDIVIFGGDLFDKDFSAVSNDVTLLTDFFAGLDANLGKFYIYGDYDKVSDTRSVLVKKVLDDANFELVTSTMRLYNGLNGFITISNEESATSTNGEDYNIVIVHNPDNYESFAEGVDFVLAADSHARQSNPFVEEKYPLGQTNKLYRVSSIGLTENNYRIFNYPELLLIRY